MSICARVGLRSEGTPSPFARLFTPAAVAVVLLSASLAQADTVAQYSTLTGYSRGLALGQSLTTAVGGNWGGSLSFNFVGDSGNPYASGKLYLLSQAYNGTPANLNNATPGYLGVATAAGGFWTFTSVVLQSNTQYFFYMDGATTSFIALDRNGGYSGGDGYAATDTNSIYGQSTSDFDFTLTGTDVNPGPIPGGGLLSYFVLGFGGAAAFRKRLRAKGSLLLSALKCRAFGRPATA